MNTDDLEQRLAQLTNLHERGVLSDAEYEAARKAAIAELLPPPPATAKADDQTASTGRSPSVQRSTVLTGAMIAAIALFVAVVAVVLVRSGGDGPGPPTVAATEEAAPVKAAARRALRFSASCTDESECPAVDVLTARDAGDVITIEMRFCDRTPGEVQVQTYDFSLLDARGHAMPWVDSITKNQRRACDVIKSNLRDNYPPGVYQARVKIFNADTNREATATSSGFTIG